MIKIRTNSFKLNECDIKNVYRFSEIVYIDNKGCEINLNSLSIVIMEDNSIIFGFFTQLPYSINSKIYPYDKILYRDYITNTKDMSYIFINIHESILVYEYNYKYYLSEMDSCLEEVKLVYNLNLIDKTIQN